MVCIISSNSFGLTAANPDATPIISNTNTFSHFCFLGMKSSGHRRRIGQIRASAIRRVSVEMRSAGILPAVNCLYGVIEAEEVEAKKQVALAWGWHALRLQR